ncbi:MAG: hypothetical protein Kow0069_24780 [Promethearchaeota archaeon]
MSGGNFAKSPPHATEGGPRYEGWEKVGFHRQVAGFFYNYVPVLLGAGLMILGTGVVIPLILPYPDAKGYRSVAGSLYALMFLLFDAGLGSAIGRFVPEYRVKDPRRAVQYVSFFVWFQMLTGLVQVTAIAAFVLWFIPPQMAHLSWVFLVYSTVQYPGMLGVIRTTLQCFQHYGKYVLSAFVGQVSEVFTQIAFILVGRAWGAANPALGELVGMSVGLVVGLYVDDFVSFAVSAKLLDRVLKDLGMSVGSCLRPTFSREVAKESVVYGLKTMPAGVYGNALGFFSFLVTFSFLPAYATWMGLLELARIFTNQVNNPGTMKAASEYAVSEAYNNGKYELSHFYVAMTLKWRYVLTAFFAVAIGIGIPAILNEMLDLFGEYWLPAVGLIPMLTFVELFKVFEVPASFTKLGRPGLDQAYSIVRTTVGFAWYLALVYGIGARLTITLLVLKDVPLLFAWRVVDWFLFSRKLLEIHPRRFVVQAYLLPTPAILLFALFSYAYARWVFPLGAALVGGVPFAVVTFALVLFIFPPGVYAPLLSLFGAWDEYSIRDFERAVPLAGPSKFLLKMMYASAKWVHDKSPLSGRFTIGGGEEAAREAAQLELEKWAGEASLTPRPR